MSVTQKFFRFVFGAVGDRSTVPDAVAADGGVSYQQGYGPDYARQKTDPASKNIERDKYNQLLYDVTLGLRQYQTMGVPEFIPAAENGGVAFPYAVNARVRYTDNYVYESLVNNNTALPTVAANWRRADKPARMLVWDQRAAGGNGGSAVVGLNARTLNVVEYNSIPGASVSGNRITLPAGTYRIDCGAPARVNNHRAILMNHTDDVLLLSGTSENSLVTAEVTDNVTTYSQIRGTFTLAATKQLSLYTYSSETRANSSTLGEAVADGNTEKYSYVEIWKE